MLLYKLTHILIATSVDIKPELLQLTLWYSSTEMYSLDSLLTPLFLSLILIALLILIVILRKRNQILKTTQKLLHTQAEKIEEEEQKYKTLTDHLPLGVYRTTPSGRFLFANPKMAKILGYDTVQELKSIHVNHCFTNREDRKKQLKSWEYRDRNINILRLIRKDAKEILVKDWGRAIRNKDRKIIYFDGIIEDLTEQRNYEVALIKAKLKAEENEKLKASFLANMSHEIRTPLNGILGFSNLLTGNMLQEEEKQQYAEMIHSSTSQLLTIINDILDMSLIESDQLKLRYTQVDINILLKRLNLQFNKMISKKSENVTLVFTLQQHNPIIYTDEIRLRQILSNIIDNAIKFTEKGHVEVSYSQTPQHIKFCISDTGMGINEEEQAHIFKRFYQKDKYLNRRYGGTGLGLSIVKDLVTLMQGNVSLTKNNPRGSQFFITLPNNLKNQENKKERSSQQTIPKIPHKKIVIVEDNQISCDLILSFLKPTQAELICFENGNSLINYLKQNTCDIILMDIQLPDIHGMDLADTIKNSHPNIPIIAQTAFAMKNEIEEFQLSNFEGYLSKPLDYNKLIEAINKVL